MSAPGWMAPWAEARGLNPAHPLEWPEPEIRALIQEKLRRFREHWRWLESIGHVALLRHAGRQTLIDAVKSDLRQALGRPPGRTWRHCACHPHRLGSGGRKAEPWAEQLESNPFVFGSHSKAELCLAWLREHFGESTRSPEPSEAGRGTSLHPEPGAAQEVPAASSRHEIATSAAPAATPGESETHNQHAVPPRARRPSGAKSGPHRGKPAHKGKRPGS